MAEAGLFCSSPTRYPPTSCEGPFYVNTQDEQRGRSSKTACSGTITDSYVYSKRALFGCAPGPAVTDVRGHNQHNAERAGTSREAKVRAEVTLHSAKDKHNDHTTAVRKRVCDNTCRLLRSAVRRRTLGAQTPGLSCFTKRVASGIMKGETWAGVECFRENVVKGPTVRWVLGTDGQEKS